MVRNFKNIYEQSCGNLVKREFEYLNLKAKVKIDDQYMVNLRDVSPAKNQLVSDNYENTIICNRIAAQDARDNKENLDEEFGMMWQNTLWGGNTP